MTRCFLHTPGFLAEAINTMHLICVSNSRMKKKEIATLLLLLSLYL